MSTFYVKVTIPDNFIESIEADEQLRHSRLVSYILNAIPKDGEVIPVDISECLKDFKLEPTTIIALLKMYLL